MESLTIIILAFIVAIVILVFVHEWGHYWVARRNGVRVEVFAVGFGPEIKGWTDKNDTRWKICAFPLGGYVKMFGEGDTHVEEDGTEREMTPEEKAVSFHNKGLGQRAAIVFAGPAVNYIFAAIVFAIFFATAGVPQPFEGPPPSIVGGVIPGSAAAEAGFRSDDRIIEINGKRVTLFSEIFDAVRASPSKPMAIRVERDGQIVDLTAIPEAATEKDDQGNTVEVGRLGVGAGGNRYERQDPLTSAWMGVQQTVFMTGRILEFVGGLIVGEQSAKDLGGPLRIAQISGHAAQNGWRDFVWLLAVLSVNLGLINLFPIPMLDGGHLAFYAVEAVRGRPLGPRAQEYGFRFGLVLVLCLFLFVTWNDLVHLKFFEFITGLFT